jgi:hypothetical protein
LVWEVDQVEPNQLAMALAGVLLAMEYHSELEFQAPLDKNNTTTANPTTRLHTGPKSWFYTRRKRNVRQRDVIQFLIDINVMRVHKTYSNTCVAYSLTNRNVRFKDLFTQLPSLIFRILIQFLGFNILVSVIFFIKLQDFKQSI